MDHLLPRNSNKPLKKVVKGLAYTALAVGVGLHALEFVGGLIFINQVKSGGIEVTLDVQDEKMELKTDEETARYLADKTISEINEPFEYFFLAGFKGAALTYRVNN